MDEYRRLDGRPSLRKTEATVLVNDRGSVTLKVEAPEDCLIERVVVLCRTLSGHRTIEEQRALNLHRAAVVFEFAAAEDGVPVVGPVIQPDCAAHEEADGVLHSERAPSVGRTPMMAEGRVESICPAGSALA